MSTIFAPFWLIIVTSNQYGLEMEKVPMPSLAACEEAQTAVPGPWSLTTPGSTTYCIPGE